MHQNRLFITNEKNRNLKCKRRPDRQDKMLDKQALTAFWASIWGNTVKHNLKQAE